MSRRYGPLQGAEQRPFFFLCVKTTHRTNAQIFGSVFLSFRFVVKRFLCSSRNVEGRAGGILMYKLYVPTQRFGRDRGLLEPRDKE